MTGESTTCAILTCLFPIGMCCVRQNVREKNGIDVNYFYIKNLTLWSKILKFSNIYKRGQQSATFVWLTVI